MRMTGFLALAAFLSFSSAETTLADNLVKYRFDPARVPVGRAYVYTKSNIDGSNAGTIAVYYADTTTIESFKWHEGSDHATKVRARIDTNSLNVQSFNAFQMAGQQEQPAAELTAEADGRFRIMLNGESSLAVLGKEPWHSYDFDFASLGYAYRFVDAPERGFSFHVFDLAPVDGQVVFADMGEVLLTAPEQDHYAGEPAVKYRIDGPGLDNRGGFIWFHADEGYLLGYEIEKPDENSYESGKLRLENIVTMDPGQWREFQFSSLGWGDP